MGTPAMARFLQKFPLLQWLTHIVLHRYMRMAGTVFFLRPQPHKVGLYTFVNADDCDQKLRKTHFRDLQ